MKGMCSLTHGPVLKLKHYLMVKKKHRFLSINFSFRIFSNSQKTILLLLLFSTSYLCEQIFSDLNNIKTCCRNHLKIIEPELCIAVSTFLSRIEKLCEKHQAHISHSICKVIKSNVPILIHIYVCYRQSVKSGML